MNMMRLERTVLEQLALFITSDLNMILAHSFICKCDDTVTFPKEYLDEVTDYLFSVGKWKIYRESVSVHGYTASSQNGSGNRK